MRIERRFTVEGASPYADIEFRTTSSEIRNPDGSVVFAAADIDVPAAWTQVACDILAQKYFRKAGVPAKLKAVPEDDVPGFLWRKQADEPKIKKLAEDKRYTGRKRLPPGLRPAGRHLGLLGLERAATTIPLKPMRARSYDETAPTCWRAQKWLRRTARSGSTPACTGPMASTVPGQGHHYVDFETGEADRVQTSAYEHPQPHACFIQSVADDLVGDGGIMDLWAREARLFKYGSGTGSNFSTRARLDGESAVGRRQVVGPDELPEDRRPGRGRHQVGRHHAPRRQDGRGRRRPSRISRPTSSGRSSKEEQKVAALVTGSKNLPAAPDGDHGRPAVDCRGHRTAMSCFDPAEKPGPEARHPRRPEGAWCRTTTPSRVIQFAQPGVHGDRLSRSSDTDWDSEAYLTVCGPELQQFGARHGRLPARRSGRRRRLGPDPAGLDGKCRQDA